MLKQYIANDTPKTTVIARLREEVDLLKGKIKELDGAQNMAKEEASNAAREVQVVTEKYNTLLEQSKNVLKIAKENKLLKDESSRLGTEMVNLQNENERLRRNEIIYWFLAGGGVLFFGWVIGRISRKKRYY